MFKLFIFSFFFSSCYSLSQSYAFLDAYTTKVPIKDALDSNELSDKQRHKLLLLEKIIDFASAQKLNTEESYKVYRSEERRCFLYRFCFR